MAPKTSTRTNSLAFAKADCHTCATLSEKCDRRRPRCGTCLSQRRRCDGFATKLVWKALTVNEHDHAKEPVASTASKPTNFKFKEGRPRRPRKPRTSQVNVRDGFIHQLRFPILEEVSRLPPTEARIIDITSPPLGQEYAEIEIENAEIEIGNAITQSWGSLSAAAQVLPITNGPEMNQVSPDDESSNESLDWVGGLILTAPQDDFVDDWPMPDPYAMPASMLFEDLTHKYQHILSLYNDDFCIIPLSSDCPDGFANPFRVDISQIGSSPFLLHAIMAVASQHLAKTSGSEVMRVQMHDHWSTAMQLFSNALGHADAVALLDTILVLMTYHVSQSASSAWSIHLQGALNLLESTELASIVQTSPRLRAQIAMLAWWDVTIALVSRREPHIPLAYLDMLSNYIDDDSWTFFTLTGCPIEFVQAMARLARLSSIHEKTKTMEWTIFDTTPVDIIAHDIMTYRNEESVSLQEINDLNDDPNIRRNRYLCIEAWRHAILLFICRVFVEEYTAQDLRKIDFHSRLILDHARCIPEDDFTQKQLLLPVFLAATEVGDERNRKFAQHYCDHWNMVSRFGHFASAGELLELIWAEWDENTRDSYWWGTKIKAGTDAQWSSTTESMAQEVLLG